MYEIRLLGAFELRCCGQVIDADHSSARLLAFLAISERPVPRSFVWGALWPNATDVRAAASLRTALWRLRDAGLDIVDVERSRVALRPEVWVDVRFVKEVARLHRACGAVPHQDFIDLARGDLLPGFWDSWLLFERERLRQELIHLYEVMCGDALERGETQLAVMAAMAAVECDPLRESSTAWLVEAHRAAGNVATACAVVRSYEMLMAAELGARPSPRLAARAASRDEQTLFGHVPTAVTVDGR